MDYKHKNPENSEQKSKFGSRSNVLPEHVLKSAKIGLEQYKNGEYISAEEFMKRHFVKRV